MGIISNLFSCDWGDDDDWKPPSTLAPGDRFDMQPKNFEPMIDWLGQKGHMMQTVELLTPKLPNDKVYRKLARIVVPVKAGQDVIMFARSHMYPVLSHSGEMFFASYIEIYGNGKVLGKPVPATGFDMYHKQKSVDTVFGHWKSSVDGEVRLTYMGRAGSSLSGGYLQMTDGKCLIGAVTL